MGKKRERERKREKKISNYKKKLSGKLITKTNWRNNKTTGY
jgi:hypothetical protein